MMSDHCIRSPLLILASASPRRAELLRQINIPFKQMSISTDESPRVGESVFDYAIRIANTKVKEAWYTSEISMDKEKRVVLAADTCGEIHGELLGKPNNKEEAKYFLNLLSGKTHTIHSAFALYNGEYLHVENVQSEVTFSQLSSEQIEAYWTTGEPKDKAGAYAIQGLGAQFIQHLRGSYSAVMGLPLFELSRALARFDIRTL